MELFKEILTRILEREEINIVFPNLQLSAAELVEVECFKALQKIKAVLRIDSLSDAECFNNIEEIVRIFEALGSEGGGRHDF